MAHWDALSQHVSELAEKYEDLKEIMIEYQENSLKYEELLQENAELETENDRIDAEIAIRKSLVEGLSEETQNKNVLKAKLEELQKHYFDMVVDVSTVDRQKIGAYDKLVGESQKNESDCKKTAADYEMEEFNKRLANRKIVHLLNAKKKQLEEIQNSKALKIEQKNIFEKRMRELQDEMNPLIVKLIEKGRSQKTFIKPVKESPLRIPEHLPSTKSTHNSLIQEIMKKFQLFDVMDKAPLTKPSTDSWKKPSTGVKNPKNKAPVIEKVELEKSSKPKQANNVKFAAPPTTSSIKNTDVAKKTVSDEKIKNGSTAKEAADRDIDGFKGFEENVKTAKKTPPREERLEDKNHVAIIENVLIKPPNEITPANIPRTEDLFTPSLEMQDFNERNQPAAPERTHQDNEGDGAMTKKKENIDGLLTFSFDGEDEDLSIVENENQIEPTDDWGLDSISMQNNRELCFDTSSIIVDSPNNTNDGFEDSNNKKRRTDFDL